DVDVHAALFAPGDHGRLLGVGAQLVGELLDGRVGVTRLSDLERVQAADHDAHVRAVLDFGDGGIPEDRALGDQLAVLGAYGSHLHHDSRTEPRGEACA